MEPPGPSDAADAGKGSGSSTKRIRLELIDKIPDNPKTLVFESTQQRYEIPLRQDVGLNSHGAASASAPRNRDARSSPSEHPADISREQLQRRTHAAQRALDRVPCNLKKVVFESTQERFEHQIRRDQDLPSAGAQFSDDDDFMPRPSRRIHTSMDAGPRKSRQPRTGTTAGECSEARQRNHRDTSRSSTVHVRCNASDVRCTAAMLSDDQHDAIEADGFGHFLRMKIDAIENKQQLSWLLDCTDPDTMVINIGPGKVLPITPWIISIVLGLPIGGQNLKIYSRSEGVTLRQQFIHALQQNLNENQNIHITNLQQELLHGHVNPLMKRCFFMILLNRLLLPSSSSTFGSLDIKRVMDYEYFGDIDWSQIVFNDLQLAVRSWHNRDKNQLTQSINGCTIFLILYYLDNIDHPLSPVDRISTPRITFYDDALIQRLIEVDTAIPIQGAITFGSQPLKSWDTTCYATADVSGVLLQQTNHSVPRMPHCHIPRLQDLLSQPIDGLIGLRKARVQSFFTQFDDTLSLSTRSIQQSLRNIMRAHANLADQFRPFFQAIGSPQSELQDTLSQNIRSLEQSLGTIATSHVKLGDQICATLHTLGSIQSRDNNNTAGTSTAPHAHNDLANRRSVHRTPSSFPGYEISSHGTFVSASTLLRDQAPAGDNTPGPFGSPIHGVVIPQHISEESIETSTAPNCVSSTSTHTTDHTLAATTPVVSPTMDIVRNVTSVHRQSSYSVISHTDVSPSKEPAPVEANTASFGSHFSSRDHISPSGHNGPKQHGECSPTTLGKDMRSSFNWPELDHIPAFKFRGKRLTKKPSKFYSPFKHGIICRPPPNIDSALRMHAFLCSDQASLKRKTLMHFGSSSLTGHHIALSFAVGNFIDSAFMDGFIKCIAEDDLLVRPECHGYRIFLRPLVADILMSESFSIDKPHPLCSPATVVETIKSCLPTTDLKKAKLIFLPVLHLRHCCPSDFPPFANWRPVPIQLPLQRDLNDSALFSMKFTEFYDGEGHGSLRTTIHPDQSMELRAEMLQYLAFHSANGVHAPPELLQFRTRESQPAFHPSFY